MRGSVNRAQSIVLACSVEGQEVVVWVATHALSHDIAAEAELHRNARGKQLLLQGRAQAAHVAQPVWLELQHLHCLFWCHHLKHH